MPLKTNARNHAGRLSGAWLRVKLAKIKLSLFGELAEVDVPLQECKPVNGRQAYAPYLSGFGPAKLNIVAEQIVVGATLFA